MGRGKKIGFTLFTPSTRLDRITLKPFSSPQNLKPHEVVQGDVHEGELSSSTHERDREKRRDRETARARQAEGREEGDTESATTISSARYSNVCNDEWCDAFIMADDDGEDDDAAGRGGECDEGYGDMFTPHHRSCFVWYTDHCRVPRGMLLYEYVFCYFVMVKMMIVKIAVLMVGFRHVLPSSGCIDGLWPCPSVDACRHRAQIGERRLHLVMVFTF